MANKHFSDRKKKQAQACFLFLTGLVNSTVAFPHFGHLNDTVIKQ
jgi:hypothetical protein